MFLFIAADSSFYDLFVKLERVHCLDVHGFKYPMSVHTAS